MSKGKLYIVPVNISEMDLYKVLPNYTMDLIKELRLFAVEKVKTARQFLRKMDPDFPIDDAHFYEQDKHNNYSFQGEIISKLKEGMDAGLLSESGYPAIADPGSLIVAEAQRNEIQVVPLVGPSSILMALAASGLNGQGFTFNGYLPKKEAERSKEIKLIGEVIRKTGFAQIFIETPYRNNTIFNNLIEHGPSDLKLCVAYDITGEKEQIGTKFLKDWKKKPFRFDKIPCIFILGE